ncbi:MAG: hypothetical protein ACJ8FY_16310 [Gemmataceae bacterium]
MVGTELTPVRIKTMKNPRSFELYVKASDDSVYRIGSWEHFDAAEYRACWHFSRLTGEPGGEYDVAQLHDGSFTCDCRGFEHHRCCKHTAIIAKLQAELAPWLVRVEEFN